MKKPILIVVIILIVGILSVGIVDNLCALTDDIGNHTWINLIGRWQSYERGYYEIEFYPDSTFVEYFYGISKGSGEFLVFGNRLTLRYAEMDCGSSGAKDCVMTMEFAFDEKTLILTAGDNRNLYKKVDAQ